MKTKHFAKSLTLLAIILAFTNCNQQQKPEPKAEESDTVVPIQSGNDSTYSQIKGSLKTGDIIVFQGFDDAGIAIMLYEEKIDILPYTHVGIIFELPERNGLPKGLYFWQAAPLDTSDPARFGNDYIKGAVSNGAQMVSLDKMMSYISNLSGADTMTVSIRKLEKPLTQPQQNALFNYACQVAGRSFSYPTYDGMVKDYMAGAMGIQSGDESFFCSKLASQTFVAAGIIDSLITNSVLPGHFAVIENTDSSKIQFSIDNNFGVLTPIFPQ